MTEKEGYTCTVQGQRSVFVTFDRNPKTGIQNICVSLQQAWMFVEVTVAVSCVLSCTRYADAHRDIFKHLVRVTKVPLSGKLLL